MCERLLGPQFTPQLCYGATADTPFKSASIDFNFRALTDECQDDPRESVSLIFQSGSAEFQLGKKRWSSSFFSPGFCEVSTWTCDDFNL